MESSPPNPKTHGVIYKDVIIRFTRQIYYDDERAFQLEVRKAPGPLPGGAFQANVDAQVKRLREIFDSQVAMNHFLYRFEMSTMEHDFARDLANLGQKLYELLPRSFRQAFPRLVQQVFEKGKGLRLVLEARAGDKADQLLSLPWETLFFPQTQAFLASSPRVLIVRHLLDAVRRSPVQMEAPFDVTHVIANNPTAPQESQINLQLQQTERDGIRQAVGSGHYRLVEEPGSVEQMLKALREHSCHIVHFLGHGEAEQSDDIGRVGAFVGRGYLRFVGADGETQKVTGEQLQRLLSFTPSVQLVVLNACHGASGAAGNIALELVYNGLPNVVAIQSNILQDAAQYFIEAFYAELQRGQSVEYAVAVGRAAIAANIPQTIDWCLPVSYTSVGIAEQSPTGKWADRFWHWISSPGARQWLSIANAVLGVWHLIVGSLLLLSDSAPALPGVHFAITGGLTIIPVLLTAGAHLLGPLQIPGKYPPPVKVALITRSFGSAALGLGLPNLYIWSVLMLLVSLGFWDVLSFSAQVVLLGLIFIPGLAFSSLFSYSQLIGHNRAFVSNAQVELPAFEWDELTIVIAGYALLLLPWGIRTFFPGLIAPPWGNLLLGVLLFILGCLSYWEYIQVERP